MAANYIPGWQTVQGQALQQALRNMTVGRDQLRRSRAIAVQAIDGSDHTELATAYGIDGADAQPMFAELDSFVAAVNGITAAWDQINAKFGVF